MGMVVKKLEGVSDEFFHGVVAESGDGTLPPRIPIYQLILFVEFFRWLDQILKNNNNNKLKHFHSCFLKSVPVIVLESH